MSQVVLVQQQSLCPMHLNEVDDHVLGCYVILSRRSIPVQLVPIPEFAYMHRTDFVRKAQVQGPGTR